MDVEIKAHIFQFGDKKEEVVKELDAVVVRIMGLVRMPEGQWQYWVGGKPPKAFTDWMKDPNSVITRESLRAKYASIYPSKAATTINGYVEGLPHMWRMVNKVPCDDPHLNASPYSNANLQLNINGWGWAMDTELMEKIMEGFAKGKLMAKSKIIRSSTKPYSYKIEESPLWPLVPLVKGTHETSAVKKREGALQRLALVLGESEISQYWSKKSTKTNQAGVKKSQKQESKTTQLQNLPLPHEVKAIGPELMKRAVHISDEEVLGVLNRYAPLPQLPGGKLTEDQFKGPFVDFSKKVRGLLFGNLCFHMVNMDWGTIALRNQNMYNLQIIRPRDPEPGPTDKMNWIRVDPQDRESGLVANYQAYKTAKAISRTRARDKGEIPEGDEPYDALLTLPFPAGSDVLKAFWLAYDYWPGRRYLVPPYGKDEEDENSVGLLAKNSMWILAEGDKGTKAPGIGNYRSSIITFQESNPKRTRGVKNVQVQGAFQAVGEQIRDNYNKLDIQAEILTSVKLEKLMTEDGKFKRQKLKEAGKLLREITKLNTQKDTTFEFKENKATLVKFVATWRRNARKGGSRLVEDAYDHLLTAAELKQVMMRGDVDEEEDDDEEDIDEDLTEEPDDEEEEEPAGGEEEEAEFADEGEREVLRELHQENDRKRKGKAPAAPRPPEPPPPKRARGVEDIVLPFNAKGNGRNALVYTQETIRAVLATGWVIPEFSGVGNKASWAQGQRGTFGRAAKKHNITLATETVGGGSGSGGGGGGEPPEVESEEGSDGDIDEDRGAGRGRGRGRGRGGRGRGAGRGRGRGGGRGRGRGEEREATPPAVPEEDGHGPDVMEEVIEEEQFKPGKPPTLEQRFILYNAINARMDLLSKKFKFKYELVNNDKMKEILGLPETHPDYKLTSRKLEPMYFLVLAMDDEARQLKLDEKQQNVDLREAHEQAGLDFDEDFAGFTDPRLKKYGKYVPIFYTTQPQNYRFIRDKYIKTAKELQTVGFIAGAINAIMAAITQVEAVRPPASVDLEKYAYGKDVKAADRLLAVGGVDALKELVASREGLQQTPAPPGASMKNPPGRLPKDPRRWKDRLITEDTDMPNTREHKRKGYKARIAKFIETGVPVDQWEEHDYEDMMKDKDLKKLYKDSTKYDHTLDVV